jgi:hypothetical protein
MRLPIHSVVLVVAALGGVALLACTTSSSGGDEPTSTPGTATPQTGGDTVGNPQTPSTCEELGALSATALSGTLDTTTESQTTSFTLPNRPSATKVKVVAVGDPSDLIGKGAVLGASLNANYGSCSHCLVVAIGCTASSCSGAALFFPRAGTGTFTALAAKDGQPFSGQFDDVVLEQVSIDPKTFASTPVVNGACMHVSTLTFGSTLSSAESGASGAGTSASSASSASSGGNDGGKSSTSSGGVPEQGTIIDAGSSGKSSTSSGGNGDSPAGSKDI